MAVDPKRVKEIFLEAAELSDEAARAAYLGNACGGDAGLRSRVEALLRSHDPEGSFLGAPAAVAPEPDSAATEALTGNADPVVAATRTAGGENGSSDDEALAFLTPSTRPDALGRIGHYEVLQVLGRGGFGIVFRAFDETLQRVVALKVMAPQLAATSPARKRFLREARSSAQVRHENVVQVYEVAEQPLPYLAMEFIPGETLQQRLDRVGPVEPAEVVRIGRQIAEGLAAAHATDLIHRDIKPANILLEGGQEKVKITDFGLARAADDASISQSGIIAGTPMYMAPEQAKGETLDQRADLFSLGSVLYQMAAGRPPFRANGTVAVLKRVADDAPRPIREIIPETPQWLCAIIAKLHAKNPDERYQSAREIADVLADCEAQLKAHARVKDFSRIPRGNPRRSGRWIWAAAAAVLLLPVIALAVTEFAGVTHLFRGQQATHDPIKTASGATPNQATKQGVPEFDGWVQLFNGRDVPGTPRGRANSWQVNGQVLVGTGENAGLMLRKDLQDFHCRIEAKVVVPGMANVDFRGARSPTLICGQAVLESRVVKNRTGGLALYMEPKAGQLLVASPQPPSSPDGWFTIEIIAEGKKATIKVDGTTTAERTIPELPDRGELVLTVLDEGAVIHFRKIEIKELPASSPPPAKQEPLPPTFTDADVQRIAALPAEQQVEDVRRELKRRNPGFDGKMETKIEGGVVTEFRIVTDKVTDIAPIRVFNALRWLDCSGTYANNGQLKDLTPLAGMNLAGLTHLDLANTKVTDAGMAYFKDCKNLMALWLPGTKVTDAGLAHFKDCKNLTSLNLGSTRVSDAGLAYFKDCKALTRLHLDGTQVSDGGLAQFKGTPLVVLWIQNTGITDLRPLHGMPLEDIRLTPRYITRGLDILRDMKSLKTIGIGGDQAWPAAEFWERYDKGEFK